MEVVIVVKSNKGNDKLCVDGYDYHYHSKIKTAEFRWSCAQRKSLMCKSVVITTKTDDGHAIKRAPTEHNHDPKAHCVAVSTANKKVKDVSSSSSLEPSQIIREAIVDCQPDQRVYLPSKRAQKIKIIRNRKTTDTVAEPDNLEDVCIPEELKYLEGELFVLSEWNYNGEKNIIMGTTNSLKELGKSQCWVMDGTFYVVPKLFRQLFTIQGFIDGQSVPLIFCLMSKKSKQAYNEFFHQLFHLALDQNINLNPQRIITDFEQTISSVAQQFFPDALYKGCLFHFGQIIWRQVQKEKLAQKYGNNEMFSISIRMLKSLSFVPPENVLEYYNELNDSNNDKDFKKICAWFKQNYIRSTRKSGAPKYSPNFWCVSDGFHDNFPRTSNSIEAWHRRLKIIVAKKNAACMKL